MPEINHDTYDHTGIPGVPTGTGVTTVRKTADETVNNSATLQNDDHLLLALAANEVWEFECVIWYLADATPDFKVAFTVPAGATLLWSAPNYTNNAGAAWGNSTVSGSGTSRDLTGGSAARLVVLTGLVSNGATAGNLQLQWAQNTAHASDTTVYTSSTLKGRRLV